jgi:hypothetical protein
MNSTDLSWLTAKQKRLITWEKFLQEELQNPEIKFKTESLIESFSKVLLKIWENNAYSETDKQEIEDLERKLEQLNEESRLRTSISG